MKKLFLSVILIVVFGRAFAQPALVVDPIALDTLTNADTIVKNLTLSSSLNGIILQPVVTRVSGTAAGKVVLLQSIDGVNFIRTDSVTLTNVVTNTALISKSTPVALYYRVEFISSGTTVLLPKLWYYVRKEK